MDNSALLAAIDLDGVIGDLVGCFNEYLRRYYGVQLDVSALTGPHIEPRVAQLLPHSNAEEIWDLFWSTEWYTRIAPYPGAAAALQQLLDADLSVVVLTSRWLFTYKETDRWLRVHDIPYTAMILGTNKTDWMLSQRKSKRITDIFVEDFADKANSVAKQHAATHVYLVSHPWNASHSLREGVIRVPDLASAVAHYLTIRLEK